MTALVVSVFEPVWISDNFIESITDDVVSYSHTINSSGGYWSCEVSVGGGRVKAENWLTRLGYQIKVFNEDLQVIWEGFVNEVSISLGGLDLTRGPLMDIGNRVDVAYQTPSYNFNAGITVGGDESLTALANDVPSQNLYGIRRKRLSAGTASSTEADQIRDTFLEDNKDPPLSQTIGIGGSSGGGISVQVNCLGYAHMLDYQPSQIAVAGTENLSDKIEEILGLDPNSLFSTDYSGIAENTTLVAKYYGEDGQTALDMIKSLVSLGDSSNSRYTWGVYGDRKLAYQAVPATYEYAFKLSDKGQRVFRAQGAGTEVKPWDVLPGEYLLVSDILVGEIVPSSLRTDPRMAFVESVTYTAPRALQIAGGKFSRVDQQLARLGLGAQ